MSNDSNSATETHICKSELRLLWQQAAQHCGAVAAQIVQSHLQTQRHAAGQSVAQVPHEQAAVQAGARQADCAASSGRSMSITVARRPAAAKGHRADGQPPGQGADPPQAPIPGGG